MTLAIATLEPRRHDAPPGWNAETFERLTDALAAALVSAYRRGIEAQGPPDVEARALAGVETSA